VERYLDALDRKTRAVKERLGELGMPDVHLLMARHLNGQEHGFMEALFADSPRTELLRAYVLLAKAVMADDLYPPLRKVLGLVAYAGAIMLPLSARAAWLSALLGGMGLRSAIRGLYSYPTNKNVPTAL
jgi:hypothetical protein